MCWCMPIYIVVVANKSVLFSNERLLFTSTHTLYFISLKYTAYVTSETCFSSEYKVYFSR